MWTKKRSRSHPPTGRLSRRYSSQSCSAMFTGPFESFQCLLQRLLLTGPPVPHPNVLPNAWRNKRKGADCHAKSNDPQACWCSMNSIDFNGLNMAESPTNMLFSTDVRLQNQVNQVNHLFDGLGKIEPEPMEGVWETSHQSRSYIQSGCELTERQMGGSSFRRSR